MKNLQQTNNLCLPNPTVIESLHKLFRIAYCFGMINGNNSEGVRICKTLKQVDKDKKFLHHLDDNELREYANTF